MRHLLILCVLLTSCSHSTPKFKVGDCFSYNKEVVKVISISKGYYVTISKGYQIHKVSTDKDTYWLPMECFNSN